MENIWVERASTRWLVKARYGNSIALLARVRWLWLAKLLQACQRDSPLLADT